MPSEPVTRGEDRPASSSPTPTRSRAYRTRESGSSTSGTRRSRQPPKQELRDQIEDGTLGLHPDNLDGAKKEFYDFVRSASAKLNQAIKAHNKGFRRPTTVCLTSIVGMTLPAPENRGRPSGTARAATNLNFMRKNCAGRTVVTAQHLGVSGLERCAR